MEQNFVIEEEDPPQKSEENNKLVWKQGYFSFGSQSRIANVTACKFITEDTVVIAHRAVAKVYLIKISTDSNTYEILDSLQLQFGSLTFHPDGMDLYNNKVYITAFTDKCCIVEIVNVERLLFKRLFSVVPRMSYHAVYVNNTGIYFGACCANPRSVSQQTIPIHCFMHATNEVIEYDTGFKRRVKGLQLFDNDSKMIVVSDDKGKGRRNIFDSFVVLYDIDHSSHSLELADDFIMKNSQVDGIIMKNTIWYATIHDADDECGYIVIGTISISKKLMFLSKISCDNFPHGIDFNYGCLMFTCYGTSSFTVKRESQNAYWTLK